MKKLLLFTLTIALIFTATFTPASAFAYSDPDEADMIAVGDLLCLNGQLSAARISGGYDFDYVFSSIKDDLYKCDFAIGNLETCLAGESAGLTTAAVKEPILDKEGNPVIDKDGKPAKKTLALPKINAPLSYADALENAGFDFLVTANNHTMDKGNSGVEKTLIALKDHYFGFTGSSSDGDRHIAVNDINGIKLAVLNYTMFLNSGNEAPAHSYTVNLYSRSACERDIAEAREIGAEYIIVYMHWGDENKPVTVTERQTAQEIADLGADLILGSHPHVLQETEYLRSSKDSKKVLCVYSLGNFVSSMASVANKDTLTLHVKLRRWPSGRIDTVFAEYKPYYSGSRYEVKPADSSGKARIASTVGECLKQVDNFYIK